MARKKTKFTWSEQETLISKAVQEVIKGKSCTEIICDRVGRLNNISTYIYNPELNFKFVSGFEHYTHSGPSEYQFYLNKAEKEVFSLESMPEISNKKSLLFYSTIIPASEVLSWNAEEPIVKFILALEKENIHKYDTVTINKEVFVVRYSREYHDSDSSHWTKEGGYFRYEWCPGEKEDVYCVYRNSYLENLFKSKYGLDTVFIDRKLIADMNPDPSMEVLKPLEDY